MDPRQTLTTALAGRYEIVREIGEGGMATVYLAKDIKHDRDVALKVLKPELGAVLGVERFLSEIKTTAKLQHPHILPLLDSGDASGLLFYVMPYVQGESLRARLERERQLPIPEAVRIAREVASALDYAHRHGVIHRDIKPENILLHDGQALVADFGIALAVQSAGGQRMTQTGLSLGTPQYMSPEQAMGEKGVDARSDIYALGAVTYEMLAGDAPFTGSSVQAIVARVLNERPTPLHTLRDTVPAGVEHAVLTALAKLAADRFGSAKEFSDALGAAGAAPMAASQPRRARASRLRDPVVVALVMLLLAAASVAAWQWRGTGNGGKSDLVVRFPITMTRYVSAGSAIDAGIAISPDGRTIAYIGGASDGAPQQVMIRRLDETQSHPVAGTEGAQTVFFAPDGKSVGCWIKGQIRRVGIDGSSPIVLVDAAASGAAASGAIWSFNAGASWSSKGVIVISAKGRLATIPETGGPPTTIPASASADSLYDNFPVVLADGETILAISTDTGLTRPPTMSAMSLTSGRRAALGLAATLALGVVDGYLVYATAANQIMAVKFDQKALRVEGAPLLVGTAAPSGALKPGVALGASGTLAYPAGVVAAQMVKIDDRGSQTVVYGEPRAYATPRFAPNGQRVAVAVGEVNQTNVWLFDMRAQTISQFTDDGGGRPEWSHDGARVIYRRSTISPGGASQTSELWWRPIDQGAPKTPVFATRGYGYWEGVMTPDGKGLVLQRDVLERGGGTDVIYRALGDTTEVDIAVSPARDIQGRPSPDGKWVAFSSALGGGANQVIVRSLTGKGVQVVISPGVGTEPIWSRDGKHLYYRDGQQFVEVTYAARPDFQIVSRRPLFADLYVAAAAPHANYDVYPDGSGFLALRQVGDRQLIVAHNWRAELKRQMAAQQPK